MQSSDPASPMEILWVAAAFTLGMAANAVGLPPLLGYLVGGFALASLGVQDSGLLHALAHFGVVFLLFTLGLHIRLRNMVRPEVLGSSLLQLLASVAVLSLVFAAFGMTARLGWTGTILTAILLGVASTVVAAKGLEERGEVAAYHGRVAIGILIIEDLILIGVLAFTGLGSPAPWAPALLLLPLLRRPLLGLLARVRHEELVLLYGLLLALGGAALFGALGLSEELGAFVAGLLLSGSSQTDEIAGRMWSLREGFLIAFFLEIGLAGLPDLAGWLLAAGLLLFLPVRVAIFYGLLTRFRLRARTAFFAAASLASYSEFAIITGAAAAGAGIIPPEMVVSLALAVALSFAFGAPFNRQAPALYRRYRPLLSRWERDVRHPDSQIERLGSTQYIVLGMGRTGVAAYEYLHAQGEQAIGLDRDPAVIEANRAAGRRVAYGVADDPELWEELDLARLTGVILAIADPVTKARTIRDLRAQGFRGMISATRMDSREQELLESAGATSVCHPLVEAGEHLARQALELRPRRGGETPGGRDRPTRAIGALEVMADPRAASPAAAMAAPVATLDADTAAPSPRPPGASVRLSAEQIRSSACSHAGEAREVVPSAAGCEECLRTGDWWVHLRICMTCGHVGCCDSSPNRHATGHFHATDHPVIRSLEPGEEWAWCYADRATL